MPLLRVVEFPHYRALVAALKARRVLEVRLQYRTKDFKTTHRVLCCGCAL
jgi:hypothetical protein